MIGKDRGYKGEKETKLVAEQLCFEALGVGAKTISAVSTGVVQNHDSDFQI